MKNLIKLITLTMVLSFLLPHYASAQENGQEMNDISTLNEPIESMEITGEEETESVTVNVNLNTEEEEVDAEILLDTDEFLNNTVEFDLTNENGEITTRQYYLEIIEMDEEVIKAKLIDSVTMEEMLIDSTQMQASAIPIIVALIVRAGLQYAIKHYGKKFAMQAMIELGVSQITKAYGGSVKNASNGKGKVITIPNKSQTIVVRLMEAGSGGRKDAYWRMSVGNKALNRAGNYSSNANETHITLQESSPKTIINIIKKFKK